MSAQQGQYGSMADAVGQTPLIALRHASAATGCTILGKAEFMNPGGSVKDRAAKFIIRDAEERGLLRRGGLIIEGSAGNTGIGLVSIANAGGYRVLIVIPDTQSAEKKELLRMLGAELREVPAAPYKNPGNYVRVAARLAEERAAEAAPGSVFYADQWDNTANRDAHYRSTGPEILRQTGGRIDGFICAVGTGGTLAGTGRFLKEQKPGIRIAAADPWGAAIHHWIKCGTLAGEDGGSVTEGIGQGRITGNLAGALIDDSYKIPDEEALPVLFDLLRHEGLCLGGSSAVNVAGAIRLARELGPGHVIVTILCDGGQRYRSTLWNPDFLRQRGLPTPPWLT